MGHARWLGSFQARLPVAAPVTVLESPNPRGMLGRARLEVRMAAARSLVLVAADTPAALAAAAAQLSVPTFTPTVLWTSTDAWVPLEADVRTVVAGAALLCLHQGRVAVTSRDGSTRVYGGIAQCHGTNKNGEDNPPSCTVHTKVARFCQSASIAVTALRVFSSNSVITGKVAIYHGIRKCSMALKHKKPCLPLVF